MDIFPPERLVYLTAESPCELETLDPSAVYIIGGIVDRNRLKGATFKKAVVKYMLVPTRRSVTKCSFHDVNGFPNQAQGIKTAKFPLQKHVTLESSRVLAVNHVFDIILKFLDLNDWEKSFLAVLPSRKKPTSVGEGATPKPPVDGT
jgi:tRNA (guanine9-N1)-methyltransferase